MCKICGCKRPSGGFVEGQYKVPNGMSYNSYVILDEKIAVMDTVDGFFTEEWLNNVEQVLSGKTPDYLVIQHMEPDHSASIPAFLKKYPNATVVSTAKGFQFMEQFFPEFSPGRDPCGTTHRCGE